MGPRSAMTRVASSFTSSSSRSMALSSARTFSHGPQYVHYVNHLDPVPAFGGLSLLDGQTGGKGAVVHRFTDFNGGRVHALEAYLDRRQPFDELGTHRRVILAPQRIRDG